MYKKIMVPLDGSELAECVLPHVEGFVTSCQVENIIFVKVIEPIPYPMVSSSSSQQILQNMKDSTKLIEEQEKSLSIEYLKGLISRVTEGLTKYKAEVLIGQVAESLADYIEANEIDLVLIATHGRSGISRWVRGSVADRILRSSRAPVLMVRADDRMNEGKR